MSSTRFFKDVYGCTARIKVYRDGCAALFVSDPYGKRIVAKKYKNEHGAKIAMGKLSDGWKEENKNVYC